MDTDHLASPSAAIHLPAKPDQTQLKACKKKTALRNMDGANNGRINMLGRTLTLATLAAAALAAPAASQDQYDPYCMINAGCLWLGDGSWYCVDPQTFVDCKVRVDGVKSAREPVLAARSRD